MLEPSVPDPVALAAWRDGTTATSLAEALGGRGGVVVVEPAAYRRRVTWDSVKALNGRVPVVLVFDESATDIVFVGGSRNEPTTAASRAKEARGIVGDGVAFVALDPMHGGVSMPRANFVVDGAGRVVFATQDFDLLAAASERLLPR